MKKLDKTAMTDADRQYITDQLNRGGRIDMLQDIFQAQQELDQFIFENHEDKIPQSIDEWVIKNTIAMESEIDEIRAEINWKYWKPTKEINTDKLHEEIIDLWHFLIQLSYITGLTAEKVHEVYMAKREENFKRQQGTSTEKDYRGGNE